MKPRNLHRLSTASILTAAFFAVSDVGAETQALIAHDSQDNSFLISWFGEPMKFYFIQQSENLVNWNFVPVFEVGDEDTIAWGFKSTAPKLFFRVVHTDDVESDLMQTDFDGDGLTVHQEYLLGSDPFNPDTSGDGIFDGIAAKLGTPLTPPGVPAPDPADTTAPIITLLYPTEATPVP